MRGEGPLSPREVQEVLQEAHAALVQLRHRGIFLAPDTAFACGEALGQVVKALALAGRDVRDMPATVDGKAQPVELVQP